MSSTQRPLVRPMKTGDAAERMKALRRADELKAIAEETIDEECRVVLLRLAQSYERLSQTGVVEPVAEPRKESPWPLKLRATAGPSLPRSVQHRTR